MLDQEFKTLRSPKRMAPTQNRAEATVAKILHAAGEVLVREGVERFSTNLICKAAGVTPPALYRYFPDKYAILEELGLRLMAEQNALLETGDINETDLETSLFQMLVVQYQVTVADPAGTAIMRSLRAIPRLSAVRINSNRLAAELLAERMQHLVPGADPALVVQEIRLAVEMGYAALEYLFDEPKTDVEMTLRRTAQLMTVHFGIIAETVAMQNI